MSKELNNLEFDVKSSFCLSVTHIDGYDACINVIQIERLGNR